jgi:hypothetical protein
MSAGNVQPIGSIGKFARVDVQKEFPEHDRAVRNWFTVRIAPVTETLGNAEAAIYAWRYDGLHGKFSLYITKEVLERNAGWAMPDLLEQRNAESALRTFPDGDVALRYVNGDLVLRHFSLPKG